MLNQSIIMFRYCILKNVNPCEMQLSNGSLIVLFLSSAYGSSNSLLFTAVADLIHYFHTPTRVSVLSCWNNSERFEFWRAINTVRGPAKAIALNFDDENPNLLPWNDHNQQHNLIVVDTACPKSWQLLRESGQLLYYRVKWIIVNRNGLECDKFLDFFQDLQVLISNEIYFLCESPNLDSFSIRQVYRYSLETELIMELFGSWSHGMIVNQQANTVNAVRRRNLNHFKLRASVAVAVNESRKHLDDYQDKHIDSSSKLSYLQTRYVVQNLNATVQYSYHNSWGYWNSSIGQYTGMIGDLVSGQSDISASVLFVTADRIKAVDYVPMGIKTRATLIFRSPKLSITDNVFLLPFEGSVWLCIVSFIILSAVFLLIIMLVELRYTSVPYPDDFRPTIFDTIMNMFGASCQQGSYLEPNSLPARCLIILSVVILMFLYASYSANIVALIQSPSNKIRTLQDLIDSPLTAGALDNVYYKHYITHENEPIRKELYERKMKKYTPFVELEEGVRKIRQGLYAFFVEQALCYKVISETFQEDEKCDLREIDYLDWTHPHYVSRKNFSFGEMFRHELFKLREFGIEVREYGMIYSKKPKCTGSNSFVPVSLMDVWPAMLCLGWGFGFSAGLLLLELLLSHVRKRQLSRKVSGTFFRKSIK
ncbi:glutamate receptor ionotropic, NMDA 1-like [Malaya genurostris]|uniref:glutamate receptor ionotropic, NMDA 1-like n=1 Tax=Malaya genurostris TaxID=325434 RepID=UPI0026F3D7B7|nr:glutamate receptor ionotropic, NMDA 1-like [Malaya genurostris]